MDSDTPRPRMGRARQLMLVLGLTLLSTLATLGAGEWLLRTVAPNPMLQLKGMLAQDQGRLVLVPGWHHRVRTQEFDVSIRINEIGLRDPRPGPIPGRFHLLAVGDSFTFGCWSPIEEAWPYVAEKQAGAGLQVINAGVPNYSTDSELSLLGHRGQELKPDMVLLQFYPGNDYYENGLGMQSFAVEDGMLVRQGGGGSRWLRGSSLYQFVQAALQARQQEPGQLNPAWPEAWYLKNYTPSMQETLDKTLALLDAFQAECKRLRVPMALLVIPSRTQVYDQEWEQWLKHHPGFSASDFDRLRPSQQVLQWAQKSEVPALDLLPLLAKPGQERTYLLRDIHFNGAGQRLVGQAVAAFLADLRRR